LSTNLKNKIEERGTLIMLALGYMVTKTLRLEGLCTVRLTVVALFKKVNEEKGRFLATIPSL